MEQKQIWVITLYTPAEELREKSGFTEEYIHSSFERVRKLSKEIGIRFGMIELSGRSRTVGFFFDKETAFEVVKSNGNGNDYNECGYYDYAIVENYKPSSWCMNLPSDIDDDCERHFFKFNYETKTYELLEKEPKWSEHLCNFGLG